MNTTIDNQKVNDRNVATKRATPRPAQTAAPTVTQSDEMIGKRPASELTRLVFMVLLGAAACIALVGVVSEAGAPGTSPDDPAPEVIVHLAD